MRRPCDTSGASQLGKPRAPHGFLFRFAVLFCGLRLTVCLAFDSLDYSTHSAVCQDEICLRLFPIGNNRCSLDILDYSTHSAVCQVEFCLRLLPIWKQVAVHLTFWIIAYAPRFVNHEFGFFQKNFRIY